MWPCKIDSNEKFGLHPCLESEATEIDYLRQVCDVILVLTLPPKYSKAPAIRYLLREVVLYGECYLVCKSDEITISGI